MDRRAILLFCAAASACGGSATGPRGPAQLSAAERERAAAADFVTLEEHVLEELAAADPRLALRTHVAAPEGLLQQLGTQSVLHEDVNATVRGGSLDLFAFRARAQTLDQARASLAKSTAP